MGDELKKVQSALGANSSAVFGKVKLPLGTDWHFAANCSDIKTALQNDANLPL